MTQDTDIPLELKSQHVQDDISNVYSVTQSNLNYRIFWNEEG